MARNKQPATKLQAARITQGFTQSSLIHAMIGRAKVLNIPVAAPSSLATMVSRWENGHDQVTDPGYRRMFRDILGRSNQELGFPDEPEDEGLEELRRRLTIARTVDAATIELFHQQIDNIRHLDRRFGAASLLDQLTTHVTEIKRLLKFSPETPLRARLAAVLADAATLAGWEALDRGAMRRAWRLHETARAAAREAPTTAADQIAHARTLATPAAVPALLATWLAAAHGEALAATGNRDAALAAFDHAATLLPTEHQHPALPFLILSDGHLSRW